MAFNLKVLQIANINPNLKLLDKWAMVRNFYQCTHLQDYKSRKENENLVTGRNKLTVQLYVRKRNYSGYAGGDENVVNKLNEEGGKFPNNAYYLEDSIPPEYKEHTIDVYNFFSTLIKNKERKLMPHLQPCYFRPYGSHNTLYSPATTCIKPSSSTVAPPPSNENNYYESSGNRNQNWTFRYGRT